MRVSFLERALKPLKKRTSLDVLSHARNRAEEDAGQSLKAELVSERAGGYERLRRADFAFARPGPAEALAEADLGRVAGPALILRHASVSASPTISSFAFASTIIVEPPRPHAPAAGTNTSGARAISSACCSGVSEAMPRV